MNWVSIKDKLPKQNEHVFIAILHRFTNAPARYTKRMAKYTKDCGWLDINSNNSYQEPTYWQSIPLSPTIKYKNKPKDCDHKWFKNSDNRYCPECNTIQKKNTKVTWG